MGYSIHVDWSQNNEQWENIGRRLLEEKCKHEKGVSYSGYCDKCDIHEDTAYPMMNYAYPLETKPSDGSVLEVIHKTNCTIMYNNDDDTYYLALTGGGMDLSQDIAFAYHIIEKWIPLELAINVCTQPDFSVSGKDFRKVMRACKESIKKDINNGKYQIKKINASIKESIAKSKIK